MDGANELAGQLREVADELDAGGKGRAAGEKALSPGALLKILALLKNLLPVIEQAITS